MKQEFAQPQRKDIHISVLQLSTAEVMQVQATLFFLSFPYQLNILRIK